MSNFCVARLVPSFIKLNSKLLKLMEQRCAALLKIAVSTSNPLLIACLLRIDNLLEHYGIRVMCDVARWKKDLISMQRPDGSWPAVPFIRMPMQLGKGQIRYLFYQSSTLTTSYVLSAL